MTLLVHRWRPDHGARSVDRAGIGYVVALLSGAVVGGFGAGTLNLRLMGQPGAGRSILGAMAGAIAAIELFKAVRGIRGSTGSVFVVGFATSVVVGRWGCFFAGLDDHTYGKPTTFPWGRDFGDGIARHPVQLYESASMVVVLVLMLWMLRGHVDAFRRYGFYLLVFGYAGQRFVWEFFKPYPTVLGPLNVFHIICIALLCYSSVLLRGVHGRRSA